jgi:2-methylisocitrate lyase-like PEP mutase family enzyme
MLEGGKTPVLSAKELQDIGFSIATFPLSTLYAAAWGVRKVLEELAAKGTTMGWVNHMTTFSDFNEVVGLPEIRAKETYYYKDILGIIGAKK